MSSLHRVGWSSKHTLSMYHVICDHVICDADIQGFIKVSIWRGSAGGYFGSRCIQIRSRGASSTHRLHDAALGRMKAAFPSHFLSFHFRNLTSLAHTSQRTHAHINPKHGLPYRATERSACEASSSCLLCSLDVGLTYS